MTGAVAALLSGALAASASAVPVWKFNGETLEETEMLIGGATKSALTIPGLTTTCDFVYTMDIENVSGTGNGEISYLPFFKCSTNSKACTVKSMKATGLPWPGMLKTIGPNQYLILSNLKIEIVYAGEECALSEVLVTVSGTAGGRFEAGTESFVFDAASFSATGTGLKALGSKVEWNATLSAEAFGPHLGEALSIG